MSPRQSVESGVDPESFLPLKHVELLILVVLEGGDRHGYKIRQEILDRTNGQVSIEAGNLYRHIRALEESEMVRPVEAPGDDPEPRRIYYRLEPFGRQVLAAELRRMQSLVRQGIRRGIIGRSGS